ncbi:hypothetical protein GCM10009716_03620 [Streptomyces sodiiphilus]|uniref:Uncharacterized protein n=2 Tax=Streptomyces sodiiphilus TaxID=226217 RepID=A0ABN2NQW9_9ACTN
MSPHAGGVGAPGATALGATPARDARDHRGHLLGDGLRAVRVYTRAAFEVVVLGQVEEKGVVHVRRR